MDQHQRQRSLEETRHNDLERHPDQHRRLEELKIADRLAQTVLQLFDERRGIDLPALNLPGGLFAHHCLRHRLHHHAGGIAILRGQLVLAKILAAEGGDDKVGIHEDDHGNDGADQEHAAQPDGGVGGQQRPDGRARKPAAVQAADDDAGAARALCLRSHRDDVGEHGVEQHALAQAGDDLHQEHHVEIAHKGQKQQLHHDQASANHQEWLRAVLIGRLGGGEQRNGVGDVIG